MGPNRSTKTAGRPVPEKNKEIPPVERQTLTKADVGTVNGPTPLQEMGAAKEEVSEPNGKAKAPFKVKNTVCPITLEEFREHAAPILLTIETEGNVSKQLIMEAKEFSTGSFGWGAGDKIILKVNGVDVKAQVSFNLTIIGSKPQQKALPG